MSKKSKKANSETLTKANSNFKSAKSGISPIGYQFYLCIALLTILTYITFSPSFENDFTNWDDPQYVLEQKVVLNDKTQWREIFSEPVSLNYHPFTMLTLAWNYQSAEKKDGKIDAHIFHSWNVWLHIFNTILAFLFIFLLSDRKLIASFFVAAVFGLHAMHVESVSWISERKDVLYTFFFLLSCISYLLFLSKKNWIYLILCFLFFAASCLSKAMAVVLPIILILIDYYRAKSDSLIELTKNQLNKIPFFALSIFIGIKAFSIQANGAISETSVFTLYQRLMFGSYGAVMYIVKFFLPYDLSAYYPYPTYERGGAVPMYFYFTPLIWVLLLSLMIYGYKNLKGLTFGIAFYIITLLLVLQFISVGTAIMADRYAYLPYIGLAFAVISVLGKVIKDNITSDTKSIVAFSISMLFILSLPVKTYERTKVWKNPKTLWTDVIEKYPNVEVAYKNRGNYYGKDLGDIDNAYIDYMQLKRMGTKDTKAYSNMGNVYGLRKQIDSALWCYNKALSLDSNNDEAYINRGITYSMTKEFDKAISDFNNAEKIKGATMPILQNRAFTYLQLGKYPEALKDYNQLIANNTSNSMSYYYRAIANEGIGNIQNAVSDLNTARGLGYNVDPATEQRIKGKL
jgi:tetratricopeptide (TPR) repeat protein